MKTFKLAFLSVVVSGALFNSAQVAAHDGIERILVSGHQANLLGQAMSASEGVLGQAEIEIRPMLRTGELMELIPGMSATQHSGSGKANQYFLRGFNLDHGTDNHLLGYPFNRSAPRPQSCVRPIATAGLPPGAPGSWDGLAVWAARGAPSSVVG